LVAALPRPGEKRVSAREALAVPVPGLPISVAPAECRPMEKEPMALPAEAEEGLVAAVPVEHRLQAPRVPPTWEAWEPLVAALPLSVAPATRMGRPEEADEPPLAVVSVEQRCPERPRQPASRTHHRKRYQAKQGCRRTGMRRTRG
jgi:hypothetical protein